MRCPQLFCFVLFFRVRASTGFERVSPVNVKSVIQTEMKYEMSVVFFLLLGERASTGFERVPPVNANSVIEIDISKLVPRLRGL